MQRRQLADPVVRGDRARPARLVDLTTKCDRRTAMLTVSPSCAASCSQTGRGLLGDVEPAGHRAGQPQDAETEAVLAALLGLLNQFAFLERGEQPERRRLVHADVRGDLADAGLTTLGQDLQHADGAVNRLHTAGALTSRLLIAQLYETRLHIGET